MRAFLSPPFMNGDCERKLVAEAFDSNFIAPCGPMVDTFEREAAERFHFAEALATVSGTCALELLARALEIGPGDVVIASDLTFIGSVGAFVSFGATPVFVDASPETWCMDPELLAKALARFPKAKAVIATDLYGQSCDIDALLAVCERFGTKLIVDAAESVGALYKGRAAGKGAWAAILSFNGNKIITTGGGGMLLTDDRALMAQCRRFASQGREPVAWYEHKVIGTHARLSNISAAIGVGQLRHLDDALRDKAEVWERWLERFAGHPWISPMPTAAYGTPNRWLTTVLLEGKDPIKLAETLKANGFEARPFWKPMHLQPVFRSAPTQCTGVAERLFAQGLCLPSGRQLAPALMDEMIQLMEKL